MKEQLPYIAARLVYGSLDSIEIRKIANALLDEGIYSDGLLEIMDSTSLSKENLENSLRKELMQLSVPMPAEKEEAVWAIIKWHIDYIAAEKIDPMSGLQNFMTDLYWTYDFQSKTKEFLGDSHGMQHLIGFYWGYDDFRDRPDEISLNGKYGDEAVREMKKEIIAEAKKWQALYKN